MPRCAYCSTTVLFGGLTNEAGCFCSERCQESQRLLQQAERVPYQKVQQKMLALHQGACPKCGGPGPVDVHRAYRVCSGLFVTKWNDIPSVCCRRCATKSQLQAIGYSLTLGWWGLPWGIIVTPMQVWKNVKAIFRGPRKEKPSGELEKLVRVGMATRKPPEASKAPTPSA
jgi:endogenous inhibitor of DNA gyrase (YacG/DUF329 family)